jgi:predicted DNA-binding transcriptional regulator AlpA
MIHANSTRSDAGARSAPTQRYLSERELAEYSGLAVRTLQKWRLFNEGPPFRKLGGAVRYALDQFDAWVAAQPGGGERVA